MAAPTQEMPRYPFVWLDLEMSGLEVETCTILEIATLLTNDALEVIAEGPDIIIHHEEPVLARMDEWNRTHHGASGLSDGVRRSTVTLAEAERCTIEFLARHAEPGRVTLCGNSVGHDRAFLRRYMPTLAAFFHYRIVDVSTIKVLAQRWYPASCQAPAKKDAHRALDDIRESIAELQHYRRTVFRPTPS